MRPPIAETVALKLLADLVSRPGFAAVWSGLDDTAKVTIMQQLITKAQALLDGRAVSDTLNSVEGCWLHAQSRLNREP